MGSTTALALAYLMLCGSRSGDALGARWSEIDDDAPIWEISVTRMKNAKSHVVPLTDPALGILKIMRERHPSSDYLFPADHGGLLSNRALESLIHRQLNLPCSVHGFCSSLRDWLGNETDTPRDVRGNFCRTPFTGGGRIWTVQLDRKEAGGAGVVGGLSRQRTRPISPKNVSSSI
jgi:integrase